MKLNRYGRLQMNNPARAAAQRRVTARHMLRLGGKPAGGRVLEVGCGRGVGIEIILDVFEARSVVAFDIDPDMVTLAAQRSRPRGQHVSLCVASATEIPAEDASFDAVFDFGVVHQIERWRDAVSECARVLRPGGTFYLEAVSSPWYRLPMNLAMQPGTPDVRKIGFTRDAYLAELEGKGIAVGSSYVEPRSPLTAAFVGDVIAAGRLVA